MVIRLDTAKLGPVENLLFKQYIQYCRYITDAKSLISQLGWASIIFKGLWQNRELNLLAFKLKCKYVLI